MLDIETTIVAVSSPGGRSAKSLIRTSGSMAHNGAIILGLQPEQHKVKHGRLRLNSTTFPVLLSFFPRGNSYTGQDVVEVQLPNNRWLVDMVVGLLVEATNGRLALPGEFTARAYLNGNMSISAAEGVCATISAKNDAELKGASLLRKGSLAMAVEPVSEEILQTLSLVEAGIDFTDDEDVVSITLERLEESVSSCIDNIESILDARVPMEALRELPRIVLAGLPNAGKSELFNALVAKRRVVVSSQSGTTRDAISEPVVFGEKEALLIDVAGIETPTSELAKSVQKTTIRALESADVILWCVAPGDEIPKLKQKMLVVHTKRDLPESHPDSICSTTGHGLVELCSFISSKLSKSPIPAEGALAILGRHELCLRSSLVSLKDVLENLAVPELVANSLRESLDSIGAITGRVTPDEVLGEVFSKFCIGK